MAKSILITLRLPPPACSPNFHKHWKEKYEANQRYKEEARLTIHSEIVKRHLQIPFTSKYNVRITFTVCGRDDKGMYRAYRPLDADNAQASLKPALDGMTAAGLVKSDSHRHLNEITFKFDRHNAHRSKISQESCIGDSVTIAVWEID